MISIDSLQASAVLFFPLLVGVVVLSQPFNYSISYFKKLSKGATDFCEHIIPDTYIISVTHVPVLSEGVHLL